ncbi:MAG: GAD-like domain-containing protein, partial [Anaerolineae bacterium]
MGRRSMLAQSLLSPRVAGGSWHALSQSHQKEDGMTVYPDFLAAHGPPTQVQPVPTEAVEHYRGRLPDDLLTFWQEVGWCAFAGGLLW